MAKQMNIELEYTLILPAESFLVQGKSASGKGFRTEKDLRRHFILFGFLVMPHQL